ncbi:MAG: CinA family nicotinamide mononucleotide deamidase-related protein [Acidobacteria bacterium]|nr:CinA family nicotinamide mononucleotide deamidase-related protein [Acidobacteriota bacterium]
MKIKLTVHHSQLAVKKMLSAEIIAIGSELLTPTKIDTNSLWLTEKLNETGIEVKLKTIVGDDELRLEETIKDALKRSDIVITTGGLGPTEDDITRKISAKALQKELIFREDVLAEIAEKFSRMNRKMPETNNRQAFIIEGAEILPNPNGSAVGMSIRIDEKFFIILPGPPRELQPMFETRVLPKLRENAGEIFVKRKILRVAGMGESALDELIAPIYKEYETVQTTILFNKSEIEIHLSAQGKTESEAENLLSDLADKIAEKVGIAVFSMNNETMEEVVGAILKETGKTLAVAESCTGGLIAQRLTKHGAVSAEVAEAMAKGIRERAATDFGISVTGIAGPTGGNEEKPVGLVFIGFADESKVKSIKIILPGDRFLIRWRASQAALDLLRRKMLKSF